MLGLGSPDLQKRALTTWFVKDGNRFSYQVTQIAEKDGVAAGLLLSFPGSMLRRLEFGLLNCMVSVYGLRGAMEMIRRNKDLSNFVEAEHDEFLIAHIGVDQQFRGQGIAKDLLEQAADNARRQQFRKLVLEVEMINQRAIEVYQKAGFSIDLAFRYTDKEGLLVSPGFYKMSRLL